MTRAKEVYPTCEIPHMWAHETQPTARNPQHNLFFADGTIYSYGRHFAIARHVLANDGSKAVLLTSRSYSSTTARHISKVRLAIPVYVRVYFVSHPNDTILNCGQELITNARRAATTLQRAGNRKSTICKAWRALQTADERAIAFARAFGIDCDSVIPPDPGYYESIAREYESAVDTRRANRDYQRRLKWEQRNQEYNRYLALTIEERIAEWRAGKPHHSYRFEQCLLRISKDGTSIETSLGATVPIDHVQRAMPIVMSIITNARTYQRNGHSIHLGHYILDSIDAEGTVRIGCHTILRAEVELLAAAINQLQPVEVSK